MSGAPGRLTAALSDRYRIERELGAGGMATVYLADDLRHHRRVALKVIRSELAQGMGSQRFLREIRLAASLNHPNILPLYDSGDAGGELYYVMPVAEGESLRDRLDREKSLPVGDAVRLASAVAAALDYAHRHGVVHRDIKPENILLHEGIALVTDFGIGKALSTAASGATLTQIGLAVGTPAYMSPEQAGGEPNLDGRSDLYSLGCMLYEMLAGEPPFTGGTVQAVIAKRFKDVPPDVTAARASVPRAVADVTRKLMALEPADRFATGALAVEALARSTTPIGTAAVEWRSQLPWIMVPPFATRDPALTELAEGLAEDITTGLSRFSYLQVVARQSALPAGGHPQGARYVIEGSLRKAGPMIRVSAQLVDTSTGTHLWAETYDRDSSAGVFALQDDLTDHIVATVADPSGVLIRAMAAPLRDRPVEELTGTELVVRVCAHNQQLGAEEHARLRTGLELAVEREPGNADLWAMLSSQYRHEQVHGFNPLPDSLGRALKAARKGVEVDPTNQHAWTALAEVQHTLGDLVSFRVTSERALALNGRNTNVGAVLALLLAFSGDWDRAVVLNRRMRELNPHHPGWYWGVVYFDHFRREEYAEALAVAKRVNMPDFPWTYTMLASAAAELGLWHEAKAAVDTFGQRFPTLRHSMEMLTTDWIQDSDLLDRIARSWRKAVAGPI